MEETSKNQVGFKTVQLFKDQKLGVGSYGVVYKAKCDELVCAAKILHSNLFDIATQSLATPSNEHKLPIRRFEQEYKFMSSLRHPNIVQYLGIDHDPDTHFLPVLLMELMDESLTHFLESFTQPIPFHIQANFCHDIALALSFLHSNNIVHRDLSGNNVLLLYNVRAKVTDFGMARLDDFTNKSHQSCTMCPGTEVYMAPETVQEDPVYTEKIDCFSFGVIVVQILTQLFPKPGNRLQKVQFSHPDLPRGTLMVCVPEIDRRQSHISQIDQNNPLLQIALDCLRDQGEGRPSAIQLCRKLAKLKEGVEYSQSLKANQLTDSEKNKDAETERDDDQKNVLELQQTIQIQELLLKESTDQNKQMIFKHHQVLQERDEIIMKNHQIIEQKDEALQFKDNEIQKLKEQIKERNIQLELKNQNLEESEELIAQFGKRIEDLERELTDREVQAHRDVVQTLSDDNNQQAIAAQATASVKSDKVDKKIQLENFRLKWKLFRTRAPRKLRRGADVVANGNKVYITPFKLTDTTIHVFSLSRNSWLRLPSFPYNDFSLVVYKNLPTGIGGYACGEYSNKILSLIKEGDGHHKWRERLPPMPTKRYSMSSVFVKESLIVVGGNSGHGPIRVVEVLNTESLQWATAEPLPVPLYKSSATICGDHIYLLGGEDERFATTNAVYSGSLSALLSSCHDQQRAQESNGILKRILSPKDQEISPDLSQTTWNKLPDLPVVHATCISLKGKLLTIGGKDSKGKTITAVHMYNTSTDSWEIVSHMLTGRSCCSVAMLSDHRLMVVGGITLYAPEKYVETDSIEVGIVEQSDCV